MSIVRSGTPFQAHSTAVTSVSATLPTGTNPGDLCIVYAFSSLTGAFGATPAGWNVVPNSTQTATAPSCIAYSRVLQAGDAAPTITLQGSANCGFGSFAYTGTNLTDADGVQNNASSTTCTAPSVSPAAAADMLVMIGGGGSKTFSAPTNGLALWLGAASSGSGIADKQLTASGATGSSAMTMSGTAIASSGIQLTLQPLDSDGEAITSTSRRRGLIRPFARAGMFATGYDEEFLAAVGDDAAMPFIPRRLMAFRCPRPAAYEETVYLAPIVDEPWTVPTPHFKPLRTRNHGIEELPFVAPVTDEDIAQPRVRYLAPLRANLAHRILGRDEQPFVAPITDEIAPVPTPHFKALRTRNHGIEELPFVAPVTDESPAPPLARMRRLRIPTQASDEQSPVVTGDDAATPLARRLAAMRVNHQVSDEQPFTAPITDEITQVPTPHFKALRTRNHGIEEQPFVAPITDESPAPPVAKMRRLRIPTQTGDDPSIAQAGDEPSVILSVAKNPGIRRLRSAAQANDDAAITLPTDDALATRPSRLAKMRPQPRPGSADDFLATSAPDDATAIIIRPIRRFWRWIRQFAEDLGLALPPANAPRYIFAATLDRAVIFAASLNLTTVFNATLNAPLIFAATLDQRATFAATLDSPVIFGATLG